MGLRVKEPARVVEAMDWALMRRGSVCAPLSAWAWSGAKSASLALSPVKGSCGSVALESRRGKSRGGMLRVN